MNPLLSQIDAQIPALLDEWRVPGLGLAVILDGEPLIMKGYGVRAQGRPEPVDAHTLFAIGSCTKAFTAAAVGLLVQEGRLAWDDPVTQYLPWFQLYDPLATRQITVRDLLCHRSGLGTFSGDFMTYGSSYSRRQLVERMRFVEPSFRLGAGYGYCNLAYVTAGLVIEAVSGQTWEDFVQARLLGPLGMTHTLTGVAGLSDQPNVAQPHQVIVSRGGQVLQIPYRDLDNGAPCGAILSSAADMARWVQFQLNPSQVDGQPLIDPAVLDETRAPQTLLRPTPEERQFLPLRHFSAYGLGWFLSDYAGKLLVTHTGGVDGMQSLTAFLPEVGLGLVLLSNMIPHYANQILLYTLLDGALGVTPPADWPARFRERHQAEQAREDARQQAVVSGRLAGTQPSHPPAGYAGTYANPIYGTVTVRAARDAAGDPLDITLDAHPGIHAPLEHWHADTFLARWSDPAYEESLVRFSLSRTGQVEALSFKVPDFLDYNEYRFTKEG